MSGKVCECGEILKNTIYPNYLEWNIYDKKKLQMYEKMNYISCIYVISYCSSTHCCFKVHLLYVFSYCFR